jgi:CDP-4-dehydro-6-deoxyglucose reductase, E1
MIPLMKNAFLNEYETKRALADFITKTTKFSMDMKCSEFEIKFAAKQGRKFGILFNSGGSANLAMLQSLLNLGKLQREDNIAFSTLTWSTNVMPIIQMGMKPVPVDCEVETLNCSSNSLMRILEKEKSIKAFFITNALGFAGDLHEIKNLCDENKVLLIEDNCEALGTEVKGVKTGNFGLSSSFSFFVAHHMSTIEGGMVCTDDEELFEMLRIVRANGWDRHLDAGKQNKLRKKYNINSEFEAKYTFYDLGYNFKPTEITGFLGLYQLQFLDENIKTREKNYINIESIIKENDEIICLDRSHISLLSSFAMPVISKTPALDEFYKSQFSGAGIEIRPMIAGNIQRQPFFKKYVKTNYDLPNADFVHDCGFYCGNYPELTESDIEIIKSCLIKKI